MSPEQIGEKPYDERSDVWSVGCIAYEMCALKPPFEASNTLALAAKINSGEFD
jgi:NIMA (never in mitosis gene a)-related kinase